MRVAFVSDWYLPRLGGIELQMRDLAQRLHLQGCHVTVITTTRGPDQADGITVKRLDVPLVSGGVSITPALVREVRSALTEIRCDLLHVHMSIVSPLGYAALTAARDLALPTLVTYHSVLGHTGVLLWMADRIAGWSTSSKVAWSGVSDLVASELRRALPRSAAVTLWNGVDPEFWRMAPDRDGNVVSIVSAIRLTRRKRPSALIRAFQKAQAMVPGTHLTLQIAGDGPERALLQAQIARQNLSRHITLLGLRSRENLRRLYASADIFVLPSRREAFGIAALEARCAGLPVVAMRAAGCADFLAPQDRPQLLAGDDSEMARHIARLASDGVLRRELGEPDSGLSRFAWPQTIDRHLTLYRQLTV